MPPPAENSASNAAKTAGILHVDMDAFFVSVELIANPTLRGKPVVVGGKGARGVVAAASYEARSFGIHSAMPSVRAQRLCPHAVFLDGDHARYSDVSAQVMAIFESYTPQVEPLSLDEAFLDVRGSRRLHGSAVEIAHAIKDRVRDELELPCSVGVATNKFLAKLASKAAKPKATRSGPKGGRGVWLIEPGTELEFLHPLPAEALWGVGPATLAKLSRLGIQTVRDLAHSPIEGLCASVGASHGRHLHALANGIDDREVVSGQKAKSIGHEETYRYDHHDRETIEVELVRMSDAVATRLRSAGMSARTVTLKVRFSDFTTITRSVTLPDPVDSAQHITRAAKQLLQSVDPTPGVRLVGVSTSGLSSETVRQLSMLDTEAPSWGEIDQTVDEIRARFGSRAIGLAVLADGEGIRVKRRGDQQWGPRGEQSGRKL